MLKKAVVMVGMAVGVLGFCCMSYGTDLDKGLSFYLPFDKSLDAKVAGGIESPQKAPEVEYEKGVKGEGVVINGMGKLIYNTKDGYFSFERGTMSFWVKANYDNAGFVETVKKHDSTQEKGYFSQQFIRAAAARGYREKCRLASGLVQTGGKRFVANLFTYPQIQHYKAGKFGLEKGKWVNLLYTWSVDEENIELYIDGKRVEAAIEPKRNDMNWELPDEIDYSMCQISFSGAFIHNPRRISTNKKKKLEEILADILPDNFTHTMDELRIYNRVLTEEEIEELSSEKSPII